VKQPRSKPAADESNSLSFPVVGIGCSAGGLEALEKFLTHVPADSGMAIVIVQHLAPDHGSALPQLLQRFTPMTVIEVAEGMEVQSGHVYVIPPNHDLSLLHGKLHLLDPAAPRGLRLPIDFFLRSLAEDQRENAIAVILSGMGSDGVFGLRAVKEKGGLTLVQEPATAEADSMPRSAIEAGVADIVSPPESLAGRIAGYLRHPSHELQQEPTQAAEILSALDRIVILLRDRSGNDFSLYKTNTLYRRIERRMAVHQIDDLDGYVRYLRGNPQELDLLFKELLIGVTRFFRDPEVWEILRAEAIPSLLARHPCGGALRAWVPACSTGEEAYSLAIVFREVMEQLKPEARFTLQIYATDLDKDAVNQARRGCYPDNIAADISPERLARNFVPEEGGGYRIGKAIREMVVFAPQNIISDPPFTKLDLISCRNLMIYFGAQIQKQLLPMFHYALNPGGLLLLGSAETIGNFGYLFSPINNKARLFRRLDRALPVGDLAFPGKVPQMTDPASLPFTGSGEQDLGQLTDQLIQQNYAPAAVLVNADGDIFYISGRTGKYLEPAAGRTNMNLHAMAREALQVTQEEMQSMVEELKSSNEELQSTNEELQSTNEELTTSKEELQSLNEELQTVNAELQSKVDDLTWVRNDMTNLLNSTEIATVFLDNQMKLRRFTTHATRLFKLIPGDVGRRCARAGRKPAPRSYCAPPGTDVPCISASACLIFPVSTSVMRTVGRASGGCRRRQSR
jgi:chemotaxis methyl-accepting protein methylase